MKYGFVIDNRKCIGCHACTVACKSEHDVPVGVNRTWVKQIEKGEYPNTRRHFSVMRCNHCTDAPCVSICPTQALFIREDGIVDFDNRRCIGCKSCMQACPYDALYIDPETHTAAKCNYCAHRVDVGLEPACVNVCPEHAIISGDMENPNSEIAQTLSRQQVTVRKEEKATQPNVFYINGDEASLNPSIAEPSDNYMWSSQSAGVGHFSRYTESLVADNDLLVEAKRNTQTTEAPARPKTTVEAVMNKTKRVYDVADKGMLWGWEVSTYVWTKAIAAGLVMVIALAKLLNASFMLDSSWYSLMGTALFFLVVTTILLIKDLDQPKRFLYVLLRPQWKSWLVKGGYSLTIFGGLVTLAIVSRIFGWRFIEDISLYSSAIIGAVVAVYTAFLFAQAKGRDFWQSPTLAIHMMLHSFMVGAAALIIIMYSYGWSGSWVIPSGFILTGSVVLNLIVTAFELYTTHPTKDAEKTVHSIVKGKYAMRFWGIAILFGNLIPLALVFWGGQTGFLIAAIFILAGSLMHEKIWVEAPQQIPLS